MDSPSEVTSIVPAVPNRTPYRYRPLQNGDDIRLVRILPGTLQQEICCEIVHGRKASRKHEYEALSYVWGDPSIVKQISIIPELSNFSVTSNCFDALRRLRWKRSPRLVWIDALCINQTDNEERIQQVREMGEIYSLSERVIVYLGESDKVSTVIFNYLRKTEHNFGRYPGESFASGIAEAVHAFLKRPWFSRVWVLQEVFNGSKFAKSGVIVLCGNETISWMHLADTCREFCKSDTDASDNYKPPSPYALNLVHGEKFDNIFDVLCATRSLNATDPRDKFFGVLAIVRESPKGDLQKLASYGQTTTMLYTQIGLHLLSIWQLVILQFSRHPHDNYPNLSSWIPDWTHGNGHENVWVSKPWVPAFYDQRSFEPEIRTLACCRATCPESDHLYHPILTATGFRLSQITSLGAIFDFKESGERCRDAVDRVLDSKGQCEDNPYLPQGFTSAYYDHHDFCSLFSGGCGPEDSCSIDISPYYEGVLHNCRLFLDDSQHTGIAPLKVETGDFVCALAGALPLCILRTRPGGGWTLVSGECYLQGSPLDVTDYHSGEFVLGEGRELETFEIW